MRDEKVCRLCGEGKPLDAFYRAAGMADGLRSECKACNLAARARKYAENPEFRQRDIDRVKRWVQANPEKYAELNRRKRERPGYKESLRRLHLQRKYGMTLEDYDALLGQQGGGCAICGAPEPDTGSLHVDHDHDTGRVRGLLCFRCNAAIGQLDEDPALLLRAAEYVGAKRRVHALRPSAR